MTKRLREVFNDEMPTRTEEVIQKACEDFGASRGSTATAPTYTCWSTTPKVSVSGLVNSLKGVSARRVRQ